MKNKASGVTIEYRKEVLINMGQSNPKVLAIIGARAGSKSLPDKNIKLLLGKPLFVWIAEAAKKSKYVSRLILSTNSPKYAEIAKSYGIEAPFLRPKEISGDKSTDMEYMTHAVKWLDKNENWKPDIILRLMPTSPLCKTEFIDRCVELLIENPEADSVRTIAPAPHHPYKMWQVKDSYLKPAFPVELTKYEYPPELPRQLFPNMYVHSDPIAVRYDALMKNHLGRKIKYHVISAEDAVDIDNEIDFILAETLLKRRLNSNSH